jgi:hypothetical protein
MNGHINCFKQLEKKIKYKHSQNLVLSESSGNEELGKNNVMSPRLYFSSGRLCVIYQTKTLMEFDSFIDAVVYLFSIYFCFDLEYPDAFKQILGLFHQFLFIEFKNVVLHRNVGLINISSLLE